MTSKAGYWLGAGLIAVAILGAILWAVASYRSVAGTIDDFQHVPVPGTSSVRLQARKHVIYFEGPRADEITPPVDIFVSDARTRAPVPIERYSGSLTYSFETSGMAHATVTPPRAGIYEVRTVGVEEGSDYQLAIGESIGGRIVRGVLGAIVVGGVLFVAGVALLIATGVRRSNRRGRAAAIVSGP